MDSTINTDIPSVEIKTNQENILFGIIKEICSERNSEISTKLKGKVNRIISDCDLIHYSSLHKLSTADESTSTLLGFMNQSNTELTFDEQTELNQAVINKIQLKLPALTADLNCLKQTSSKYMKSNKEQLEEIEASLDDKINTLREQENEKVELMMEWVNHRFLDITKFTNHSSEFLSLKTKILALKSKILHLQILQNIFMETNQSIKAYTEVHKDLKDGIKETEQRIKKLQAIIDNDNYFNMT